MLQNRRRQRIASIIIGSMGDSSPKSADDTSHYMNSELGKSEVNGNEALEMACGTILAAMRADDVGLLCRAFKAAFKACESGEDY